MQFLRSVCYNSFQVPHCLIRFFTNRAKSVILFYSEVFFSQPSFSEFLIFKLYKKLLSTTIYLWLITLTASKELSILLLKLYNDGAIGMCNFRRF